MSDEEIQLRNRYRRPETEIDFTMLTTDSVWGRDDVPIELRDNLNKIFSAKDETGNEKQIIQSLWGLLGFYTRDVRLANLDRWEELPFVRYHLDLAGDLLDSNYRTAFLTCLKRGITTLETSQSKGGFLRKRQGTFTHETSHREEEPPKKSLFGLGKKKEERY